MQKIGLLFFLYEKQKLEKKVLAPLLTFQI